MAGLTKHVESRQLTNSRSSYFTSYYKCACKPLYHVSTFDFPMLPHTNSAESCKDDKKKIGKAVQPIHVPRGQIELPSEGSKKEAEKSDRNGATPCNLSTHPRSINQHLDVFFSRIIANSVHANVRWNRWWAKCVWGRPLLCALFVISTRHLLVPLRCYIFPPIRVQKPIRKKQHTEEGTHTSEMSRECPKSTRFSPLHERKNGARKKGK